MTERDQQVGRRAAVGLLVTVATALAVGPLGTAANLIAAPLTGRTPNVAQSPGVTTLARWRDNLPVDIPWWAFLAVSLALAVLLVVVWKPERHYLEFWRRKVILAATPVVLGVAAVVWAVMSFGFGIYYTARDEWQGYLYLPGIVALVVAGCAFVQARRARRLASTRRRRPPRAKGSHD